LFWRSSIRRSELVSVTFLSAKHKHLLGGHFVKRVGEVKDGSSPPMRMQKVTRETAEEINVPFPKYF